MGRKLDRLMARVAALEEAFTQLLSENLRHGTVKKPARKARAKAAKAAKPAKKKAAARKAAAKKPAKVAPGEGMISAL